MKKKKPRPTNDIQPYIAGQSLPQADIPEDPEEYINDCAICFSLQEAATALMRISNNINMSCMQKSPKKDFGLEKSFVDAQVSTLKRMMKFHQFYHATGTALNEGDFGLSNPDTNNTPPKFRRFRPQ